MSAMDHSPSSVTTPSVFAFPWAPETASLGRKFTGNQPGARLVAIASECWSIATIRYTSAFSRSYFELLAPASLFVWIGLVVCRLSCLDRQPGLVYHPIHVEVRVPHAELFGDMLTDERGFPGWGVDTCLRRRRRHRRRQLVCEKPRRIATTRAVQRARCECSAQCVSTS